MILYSWFSRTGCRLDKSRLCRTEEARRWFNTSHNPCNSLTRGQVRGTRPALTRGRFSSLLATRCRCNRCKWGSSIN
ncbi:unnamed protein product, partial [Ectocarpus sp. 13 AM-2016]